MHQTDASDLGHSRYPRGPSETLGTVQIFDTMTRRKTVFVPRTPGKVSMYVCGPTVYDVPHLGHGRTALTYDIIRRYLTWAGFEVTMASNVTDIDDKIVARAQREGRTEANVAKEFTASYDSQMKRLGVLEAHSRPHATHFVSQMIDVISELLSLGAAYEVAGKGVYFAVESAPGYGQLAGRSAEQLNADAGARIDVDPDKRSPLDFALWKAAQPGEPRWDTPWGPGRPGWHTECVAMSLSALGPGFDIHGGGDDLIFPHHQNEWAQATAAGEPFARYWVHSAMVNVGSQKMAKSVGNYTDLAEAIDAVGPRAVRLLVLQTHYRKAMEMGPEALKAARSAVERLDAFVRRVGDSALPLDAQASLRRHDLRHDRQHDTGAQTAPGLDTEAVNAFAAAMDDDFSTPSALDVIFRLVRRANVALDADADDDPAPTARTALALLEVLGLRAGQHDDAGSGTDGPTDTEVEALLARRATARAARDFATSDQIRDELAAVGIVVSDRPDGHDWHRR